MSRIRHKTFALPHARFFVERPENETESWFDITVKGRRERITSIDPERSALVVVDMQEGCMNWSKLPGELGRTHKHRTRNIVVPNLRRLIKLFREKDMVIVYLTLGEDKILAPVAPDPERLRARREYKVIKYSGGAFATDCLDNLLRENGIRTLFFTGTDTAGCVSLSVAAAFDRSYQTILIEDALLSCRQDLHDAAIKLWSYMAFVRSTDQVVNDYPWKKWVDPKAVEL